MSDLCIFSNEKQLPATSFTHDSGDSIGSQNISSTSPEVNFTTSSYYATLVIPFCCDDAPGTPMGPDTGMEYDLARREVAVADTCSRFSTQDVPVTLITDSHCGTESLDGPRAVQRRPPTEASGTCALIRCLRRVFSQTSYPTHALCRCAQALICRAPSTQVAMMRSQQLVHSGLRPPGWLPERQARRPLGSAGPAGSIWPLRLL